MSPIYTNPIPKVEKSLKDPEKRCRKKKNQNRQLRVESVHSSQKKVSLRSHGVQSRTAILTTNSKRKKESAKERSGQRYSTPGGLTANCRNLELFVNMKLCRGGNKNFEAKQGKVGRGVYSYTWGNR